MLLLFRFKCQLTVHWASSSYDLANSNEGKQECKNCKYLFDANESTCPACGFVVGGWKCPSCGQSNSADATECSGCGA